MTYAPVEMRLIDMSTGEVERARVTFGHVNDNWRRVWTCNCGCDRFEIVYGLTGGPEVVCLDCRQIARGWFK